MNLSIRTDLPRKDDYFALYQTTGWNENGRWTADILHEALKNSWHLVTIYHGDRLVASGRIVSDGFIQCLICDMIVLPEYQSLGLGRTVLNAILEHCQASGIRWVQLACAKGKKGFYERFGFQERASDAPGMQLFL
ncbi:GNAT family N-acetyltransferase [Paenibacillus xanthanilyticus]|uniref:GNAT family N-acetyltransferase n=1 Tax=Paenibacillus xanthanilyticus TaxID=1783531 RepID=A0ABV8KB55_9BACL